jgi:microcystin-dependent protein
MAEPYIGQINLFAGGFAPRNYSTCAGQLLPIAQYTALFSILGTIYGGDGRTTFGLPNLQSRAPMHWGSGAGLSPRRIGQTGGANSVPLTEAENAAHSHAMLAGVAGTTNKPSSDVGIANAAIFAPPSTPDQAMNVDALTKNGSGTPHENRQPYLAVNFIIALDGTYPSRN